MVRACHRDTCPVGIATQRADLRAKFAGTPRKVATYLRFVAEEVRQLMAALGIQKLDELIGRTDLLEIKPSDASIALDLTPLLTYEGSEVPHFLATDPIQRPRSELGLWLAEDAFEAVRNGQEIELSYLISNSDRTVGATLGGLIGHEFGEREPPGMAKVNFTGQAGQSFGAFLTAGVEFRLTGEANDYVGKGMGGGRIIIIAPEDDAGDPHLVGNTVLYGATGGELLIAGKAGERFAVRNSGADAVIEGAGDHACEYMTGGTVVILGPVGWNLGAGMTGGRCYVWDPTTVLPARVNPELVEPRRLSEDDIPELLELLARHAEETLSELSLQILGDTDHNLSHFWMVTPRSDVAKIESRHEGSLVAFS